MTRINSLSDTVSQLQLGSRAIQSRIQALAAQTRRVVEQLRWGKQTPPSGSSSVEALADSVPEGAFGQPVGDLLAEALEEVARLRLERGESADALSERGRFLEEVREEMTQLRAERSVLQAEVTGLNTTLAEVRSRRVSDLSPDEAASADGLTALQDERQVLAIKVEVLSEQQKELERLREESALHRADDQRSEELRQQLRDLMAENARLTSLELIREHPPIILSEGSQAQIGSLLDGVLGQLAERESARGAVVADLAGLVVASDVGDAESFAAMAAMLHHAGERAAKPLPLASAQRLMVVDENELTVTVIPFQTETDELLLVTLTAGPGPAASHVTALLAQVDSTLG